MNARRSRPAVLDQAASFRKTGAMDFIEKIFRDQTKLQDPTRLRWIKA